MSINTVNSWASAHDLRRAIGLRWSNQVMPPVLQQLMQHESIDTTVRFYVGRDAESTAELLYAAIGASFGASESETPSSEDTKKASNSYESEAS